MLDNTLSLTYNSTPVTMTRVNQDSFSSTYFGEEGNDKLTLSVKHTIPGRGQPGESHLIRLDVEEHSIEGEYIRTSSVWTVIRTSDNVQDSELCQFAYDALRGIADSTFAAKVIGRES